jgi:FtsZ-interacting cell division protein ZipA
MNHDLQENLIIKAREKVGENIDNPGHCRRRDSRVSVFVIGASIGGAFTFLIILALVPLLIKRLIRKRQQSQASTNVIIKMSDFAKSDDGQNSTVDPEHYENYQFEKDAALYEHYENPPDDEDQTEEHTLTQTTVKKPSRKNGNEKSEKKEQRKNPTEDTVDKERDGYYYTPTNNPTEDTVDKECDGYYYTPTNNLTEDTVDKERDGYYYTPTNNPTEDTVDKERDGYYYTPTNNPTEDTFDKEQFSTMI